AVSSIRDALQASGFEVVGEYSPYKGAHIIGVTNDALKSNAANSDMGGFGAVQRIAITRAGNNTQVSTTNPRYMANIYRMKSDLRDVYEQLVSALGGKGTEYGSKYGFTSSKLRKYQYKDVMPYFDDVYKLAKFDSQEKAINAVEAGFESRRGGVSKVYRVDIPDKDEVVFGVAMTAGCSNDKYIMDRIDGEYLRGTPHLPYEILISKGDVLALHPKFRIAQSFPDLNMMQGSHTFFNIMCAPGAIEDVLLGIAGGE
ncbi:MAG: hypothetical protein OEY35_06140, partial [Gammaproteobacteria bacterium]|nr:hypothetical protein [Gammaproteobacteria bacterium]